MKNKQQVIRILMIGPLPVLGGGASVLFNQLVKELDEKPNVSLIVVDTGRKRGNSIFQHIILLIITSLKLIRNILNIDVVSFHSSPRGAIYFGPIVYFITRIIKKPLIFRGFGGVFDVKYENGSFITRKSIEKLLKSEKVLLETKALMNYFRQKFPKANLVWYPNSRCAFKDKETVKERHSSEFKFIFLGHIKPSKGIYEIVQAANMIAEYTFTVDIYGPLMDGIKENVFHQNSKITYRGAVNPENILQTLSKYDVLLMPTYYEGEGYPGVILEAYMTGIPVIASNWHAIPEIVEDGVSGILVPPKNPKALAEAMSSLISDVTGYYKLKYGVNKYMNLFDSVRWTNKFLELCYDVKKL